MAGFWQIIFNFAKSTFAKKHFLWEIHESRILKNLRFQLVIIFPEYGLNTRTRRVLISVNNFRKKDVTTSQHILVFRPCMGILWPCEILYSHAQKKLPEVFHKKDVLKDFAKFTRKQLCQSLFLIKLQAEACYFIKRETLAKVFPCEFCKIYKNTFIYRTPPGNIFELSGRMMRCA